MLCPSQDKIGNYLSLLYKHRASNGNPKAFNGVHLVPVNNRGYNKKGPIFTGPGGGGYDTTAVQGGGGGGGCRKNTAAC